MSVVHNPSVLSPLGNAPGAGQRSLGAALPARAPPLSRFPCRHAGLELELPIRFSALISPSLVARTSGNRLAGTHSPLTPPLARGGGPGPSASTLYGRICVGRFFLRSFEHRSFPLAIPPRVVTHEGTQETEFPVRAWLDQGFRVCPRLIGACFRRGRLPPRTVGKKRPPKQPPRFCGEKGAGACLPREDRKGKTPPAIVLPPPEGLKGGKNAPHVRA